MDDLIERLNAATDGTTPGPWTSYQFGADWWVANATDDSGPMLRVGSWHDDREANANLIAAARQLVPEAAAALAGLIEAARARDALLDDYERVVKDKDAEIARLRRRLADCIVWMDTREKRVPGMPRICDMARAALTGEKGNG